MTSCEQFVRWLPSFEYVSSQVGSRSSGMCVCARCKHMFLFCSYNSIMIGQKLQEHRSGQNKSHNKHDFAVKTRLFRDQGLYQNIANQPLPLQKKNAYRLRTSAVWFSNNSEIWWQLWIRSSHRSKNPDPRSILGRSRWKPWWFFAMFWSKNDIAKSLNWEVVSNIRNPQIPILNPQIC
jgi:hypothetical protein